MQMIAEKSEFSVGYLYRHFPGKKEMLDEIIDTQLAEFARARTRIMEILKDDPLGSIRAEVAECARQVADNADLVPLFLYYEKSDRSRILDFALKYRQEVAEHFQVALDQGLIRGGEPRLIAAAMDGVVWGLIKAMAETGAIHRIEEIPDIIENLMIAPLLTEKGKEKQS